MFNGDIIVKTYHQIKMAAIWLVG